MERFSEEETAVPFDGEDTSPNIPSTPAADPKPERKRLPKVQNVLVIGAGMAGLAAARELQERGYQVLIVEARERLGGRLKGVELEGATSVDLGGALIHGIDDNPLHELVVKRLGIQAQPVSECLLLTESGWPVDPRNDEKTSALFNECLDATFQCIEQQSEKNGRKEAFGKRFEKVCKDKNVHADEVFRWHQANLELSCGAGFQQLGFQWNDDEPYGFDGDHVAIPSTWPSVCESLAEPLEIIYEQPVSSVHIIEPKSVFHGVEEETKSPPAKKPSPKTAAPSTPSRQSRRVRGETPAQRRGDRSRRPVDMFTVDHSIEQCEKSPKRQRQEKTKVMVKLESGHTLQADAVVCTIPLGVMKRNSVAFDPPLSREKQEAIKKLGTGLLNKCAMSFPSRFWPESDFLGLADTEHSYLILNAASFTEKPVLIFLYGGTFAKKVESWTDSAVIEDCLRVLNRICSRIVPKPIDYQVTRWGREQHSFMSFTYIPPGVDGNKELDALSQPICSRSTGCPVVMFAGEHTTKFHPSTIHGAFLSGIREAYRLDCFIAPQENNYLEFSNDEVYHPTFADSNNTSPSMEEAAVAQQPRVASRGGPRRGTKVQLQQRSNMDQSRGKISHDTTQVSPARKSHRSKGSESLVADANDGVYNDEALKLRILRRSYLSFGPDYEFISSMVLPIHAERDTARYKTEQTRNLCRQAVPPHKKKAVPQQWIKGKHTTFRSGGFKMSPVASASTETKTRSGRLSKPVASAVMAAKKSSKQAVTKTRFGRISKPS